VYTLFNASNGVGVIDSTANGTDAGVSVYKAANRVSRRIGATRIGHVDGCFYDSCVAVVGRAGASRARLPECEQSQRGKHRWPV
jgi:hypothetical protein